MMVNPRGVKRGSIRVTEKALNPRVVVANP
jgi:hypothetical protein